MVIVVITDCPSRLRGDISKWLFEINTGVYVGNISARVREGLWERVCENVKHGQATMVYPVQGEQKMEFCVHNTSWEVVDLDGIKLMRRPLTANISSEKEAKDLNYKRGFSNAAKHEKHRRIGFARQKLVQKQNDYIVVDVETTGLSYLSDEIIEVAALHIIEGKPAGEYQSFVLCNKEIPESVKKLTGITDKELKQNGRELRVVLQELIDFLADNQIVCHNAAFDLNFIHASCKRNNIMVHRNKCVDTLPLAKCKLKGLRDYKLQTIAKELSIDTAGLHRALKDCYTTYRIYSKLIEM